MAALRLLALPVAAAFPQRRRGSPLRGWFASAGLAPAARVLERAPLANSQRRSWSARVPLGVLAAGTALGLFAARSRRRPDRSPQPLDVDPRSPREDLDERLRAVRAKSDEELRQLASFLSHELRQPLGALGIWAELLETQYRDDLDERGTRYLREISGAVRRLADLVSAQLALVRASTAVLEPQRFSVRDLLGDLLGELSGPLQAAQIRVEVGSELVLVADRAQIHQLLRHLLESLLGRAQPGVLLPIAIGAEGSPDGARVCVRVDDESAAFALEDATRILQAVSRPDLADPGALGLAIGRRIAVRHGGSLQAEPAPEGGTRFLIALPAG